MACPFFYPVAPFDERRWSPRPQMPLGDPYDGECRAAAGYRPGEQDLRNLCNMGYARGKCPRFQDSCSSDAARFSAASDDGETITIAWVVERDHRPATHGRLEYSKAAGRFTAPPADQILHRQAAAYVAAYLRRKAAPAPAGGPSRR
jgi:hypothetical protein